jgi:hypothetical protein
MVPLLFLDVILGLWRPGAVFESPLTDDEEEEIVVEELERSSGDWWCIEGSIFV